MCVRCVFAQNCRAETERLLKVQPGNWTSPDERCSGFSLCCVSTVCCGPVRISDSGPVKSSFWIDWNGLQMDCKWIANGGKICRSMSEFETSRLWSRPDWSSCKNFGELAEFSKLKNSIKSTECVRFMSDLYQIYTSDVLNLPMMFEKEVMASIGVKFGLGNALECLGIRVVSNRHCSRLSDAKLSEQTSERARQVYSRWKVKSLWNSERVWIKPPPLLKPPPLVVKYRVVSK